MTADALTRCVLEAIRELNGMRGPDEAIPESLDSVLLGDAGALDSLGLVNLIVAVESKVEEAFGVQVSLVASFGSEESQQAFTSARSLVDYLQPLVAAHS